MKARKIKRPATRTQSVNASSHDRFKLSSFLDISGELGQFLGGELGEERSERMRLEGIGH